MVGADLLEPIGAGRGRRYKASEQLRQLSQEMQQVFPRPPDPEPYAGLSDA